MGWLTTCETAEASSIVLKQLEPSYGWRVNNYQYISEFELDLMFIWAASWLSELASEWSRGWGIIVRQSRNLGRWEGIKFTMNSEYISRYRAEKYKVLYLYLNLDFFFSEWMITLGEILNHSGRCYQTNAWNGDREVSMALELLHLIQQTLPFSMFPFVPW